MPHTRPSAAELRKIYDTTIDALCYVGADLTLWQCRDSLTEVEESQFSIVQKKYNIKNITPKNIYFAKLKEQLGSNFDEDLFRTIYETSFVRSRRSVHSKSLNYGIRFKVIESDLPTLKLFIDVNTVANLIKNHYQYSYAIHFFQPIYTPAGAAAHAAAHGPPHYYHAFKKFTTFSDFHHNVIEAPSLFMARSSVLSLLLVKLSLSWVNLIASLGFIAFMGINFSSPVMAAASLVIAAIFLSMVIVNTLYMWLVSKREIDACYHQLPNPDVVDIEQTFLDHFKRADFEEIVSSTTNNISQTYANSDSGSALRL